MTAQQFNVRRKAEVTVFFSLILCTVMAFVIVFARHSLLSYIKLKAEVITDSSVKSAFSEYSKNLFDKYNILCIDSTYKGKKGNIEIFERHIKEYMEESFAGDRDRIFEYIDSASCEVEKCMLLPDLNAKPFIFQACFYAEKKLMHRCNYKTVSGEEYGGNIDVFMDELKRRIAINSLSISIYDIPSERVLKNGNYSNSVFINEMNITDNKYEDYSEDKIIRNLSMYSLDKYSTYTNKKDFSYLNYENEYIIFGKKSDYENMTKMVEKMLRNDLHFYRYEDYIEDLYDRYINGEGHSFESFDDYFFCEIDFENDNLPYVKSINSVIDTLNKNKNKRGFYYEDYLFSFLNNTSKQKMALRMLDLIEINMRHMENDSFRIDNLIEYAKIKTNFHTNEEKNYYKEFEYGYFLRY